MTFGAGTSTTRRETSRAVRRQPSLKAEDRRSRGVGRIEPQRGRREDRRLTRLLQYGCLAVTVVLAGFPLLWMAVSAIRPDEEIVSYPPTFVPQEPTLHNFTVLFRDMGFSGFLKNSALLSFGAVATALVFGTLAAYAVARFGRRFRIARWFGELSLLAYMVPTILLLVPIAQLINGMGLANNIAAMAVVYAAQMLPLAIWILRSYFRGDTVDLEEAAMIDGCTRLKALFHVTLPYVKPGLIAAGVFVFNAAWSEYLFASIFLTERANLPLSVGVTTLFDQTGVNSWGVLMAAGVVTVLPPLFLFGFAQRHLVTGFGEGAVRG